MIRPSVPNSTGPEAASQPASGLFIHDPDFRRVGAAISQGGDMIYDVHFASVTLTGVFSFVAKL